LACVCIVKVQAKQPFAPPSCSAVCQAVQAVCVPDVPDKHAVTKAVTSDGEHCAAAVVGLPCALGVKPETSQVSHAGSVEGQPPASVVTFASDWGFASDCVTFASLPASPFAGLLLHPLADIAPTKTTLETTIALLNHMIRLLKKPRVISESREIRKPATYRDVFLTFRNNRRTNCSHPANGWFVYSRGLRRQPKDETTTHRCSLFCALAEVFQ
jgi:hypothetical protein